METRKHALIMVILLVGLSGCLRSPNEEGPGIGQRIPDFRVTTIDGEPFTRTNFTGKALLLDLMGVNCLPCREEMPHLVEVHDRFAVNPEFVMISVDTGSRFPGLGANDVEEIRDFKTEFGANWTFAYDNPNDGAAVRLQMLGIPTVIVADTTGKIVFRNVGITSAEKLTNAVATSLGVTP